MNPMKSIKSLMVATAVVALVGGSAVSIGRSASAQEATPAATESMATVSVTGNGIVYVTPDAASMSVGVNVIEVSLSEAQAKATTQMTAVLDALKAEGIDAKDIQTSNYSVNIMQNYDNNGMPSTITGYQVNNQVNVIVRDLAKVGEILDAAVNAGANSIYGVSFMVTDTADASSQARTMAVKDATARAEQLATAAGMKLGRVLSISESYGYGYSPIAYAEGAGDMAKSSVPVQAGSSTVAVDVSITFELVS